LFFNPYWLLMKPSRSISNVAYLFLDSTTSSLTKPSRPYATPQNPTYTIQSWNTLCSKSIQHKP
jgi:hypothetical protein